MQLSGVLHGLKHQYEEPLRYYLCLGDEEHALNDYLGQQIQISFEGNIYCVHCGRQIKKSFNTGACFPCFKKLPEHDLCIVKPHQCHHDQGTCRDEEFAQTYCMIPHYVYLALSSDVKVGLTRKNNQFKRWGDQGAVQAFPIAELPTRKMAGELEMAIANHIPDKTNWRKMLQGNIAEVDLVQVREEIIALVPEEFQQYILKEEELIQYTYPILEQLEKIKSYNLDKQPLFTDRLIGIKGQYLMFEQGVINMRKYAGYQLSIKVE
ncbi:DUF2797 domain-containing protein [Caldalkalibacillus mannanilyticus]|uniref:DUF2797 domain-containing protein n=1 Tax=Caldalkalibacillus mannanilyticus TaxID=1418 RepID=UPI00046A0ABF|nr:DUF2797 domain-containing protein [Caldalkalibacillus mannanilyticus]